MFTNLENQLGRIWDRSRMINFYRITYNRSVLVFPCFFSRLLVSLLAFSFAPFLTPLRLTPLQLLSCFFSLLVFLRLFHCHLSLHIDFLFFISTMTHRRGYLISTASNHSFLFILISNIY